jgi:gas vesicle protein
VENYERIMKSISNRLPVRDEDLNAMHKEAKEAAIDHFEHKSVGSESAKFLKDLKDKIATKVADIRAENEEVAQHQCLDML